MQKIKVETLVNIPAHQVWQYFTAPEHITQWNFAHESWHCPKAENNLKAGEKFNYRMEARDGSFGFDFSGTYNEVVPLELIKYRLDDGRHVTITFEKTDNNSIKITETFDAEKSNPVEMQEQGWQAILNNFKKYAESER